MAITPSFSFSSRCRCTDYEIIKYRGKISGPIMVRIDIQKEVHPVDYFSLKYII
ncbi:MAG: ATP-binding protein [Oliverpabstia sp.]